MRGVHGAAPQERACPADRDPPQVVRCGGSSGDLCDSRPAPIGRQGIFRIYLPVIPRMCYVPAGVVATESCCVPSDVGYFHEGLYSCGCNLGQFINT